MSGRRCNMRLGPLYSFYATFRMQHLKSMTGGIDMQKRNRKQYFGLALMMGLLASSSVVAANNCTTGAKAAAQICNKHDKCAAAPGGAAGVAGGAALSGGDAL